MAERKPLFLDSTEGFSEEMATTDSMTLGGLTMGGAIDMGSNPITNVEAADAAGEALVYGQAGANVGDLTVASGGDINLSGGGELVGLPSTPSGNTAAASKEYVDAVAQGLDVHGSVRVATTAAGTLASDFENGDDIDGVTLATGQRILIKNQASGIENGIYVVNASGAPTRADDWPVGYEAAGAFVFVEEGTTNADSGWVCTNDQASDTTGTHSLAFSQFSGAGQVQAGDGLDKTGNTLSVNAGDGIAINSDNVEVDPDTASTTTTEANAVAVAANGVSIKVDDSTIEGSGQGAAGAESLRVKDGGITAAKIDPDIDFETTGNITTTGGIFTGDGSGLTNLPAAASTDAVTVNAKKASAGTISVGQAVHLVGHNGTEFTVELADADTASLMPSVGIASTTITDGTAGTVVLQGLVNNMNTSAWSAGDSLYIDTTAGALTNVKPTGAANLIQRIGEVASVNASTGRILVLGAGRSNDLPNLTSNNTWFGDGSDVPTETPLGDGLTVTPGTSMAVDITADIGLHFSGGKLEIELDNSPDTLDADASGLKVVGLPSLFKVNDVAVSSNVSAANLDTLTAGGASNADALHTHSALEVDEAERVENDLGVDESVAIADPVYITSTGSRVGKALANTIVKSRVIGLAKTAQSTVGDPSTVVSRGIAAGVLSGATPGQPYFLQAAGGIGTSLPGAGSRVVKVGYAWTASDLWVEIIDYGRRAA